MAYIRIQMGDYSFYDHYPAAISVSVQNKHSPPVVYIVTLLIGI